MTKLKTVIGSWLVLLVEQLVAQGLDRVELTAGLWGDEAASSKPTRQFDLVLARRLWQRAAVMSQDPLLGLKVGALLPLQAMNIITGLIMQSSNLREAMRLIVRYQQLITNSGELSSHPVPGGLLLRYVVTPSPVPMHPAQSDSILAGLFNVIQRCSPQPRVRPRRMALISPHIECQPDYSAYYGCPVECAAAEASFEFDNDALDAPFLGADAAMLAVLCGHANAMLRAQNRTESLEASVRASVAAHGLGKISCDEVAIELGISTRTLQRRLTENRTTFRSLVEAARMCEALTLLSGSRLSMAEICHQLGYSEPSSFSHAVKAYWGITPRELRLSGPPKVSTESAVR